MNQTRIFSSSSLSESATSGAADRPVALAARSSACSGACQVSGDQRPQASDMSPQVSSSALQETLNAMSSAPVTRGVRVGLPVRSTRRASKLDLQPDNMSGRVA